MADLPDHAQFELSDGEMGLVCLALLDLLPRLQFQESITTGEKVETKNVLFKFIEARQAANHYASTLTVHPQGMELQLRLKDEPGPLSETAQPEPELPL